MKYTPKELKTNVNISRTSHLKEFFILSGGVLGFLFLAYLILGFCVDLVAPWIPVKTEQALGKPFEKMYAKAEENQESKKLAKLLQDFVELMPEKRMPMRVHLVKNNTVNAMAIPGGNIVVFSGLMKEVGSENEIAFVLAHELGHFAHRDHLRGLGRGLVLYSLLTLLIGSDNSISGLFGQSLTGVQMKFSQNQETRADMYALDLMNRRYGHVIGAMEFMEKIAAKEERGRLAYYFATHPHPESRIEKMETEIRKQGYIIGAGGRVENGAAYPNDKAD